MTSNECRHWFFRRFYASGRLIKLAKMSRHSAKINQSLTRIKSHQLVSKTQSQKLEIKSNLSCQLWLFVGRQSFPARIERDRSRDLTAGRLRVSSETVGCLDRWAELCDVTDSPSHWNWRSRKWKRALGHGHASQRSASQRVIQFFFPPPKLFDVMFIYWTECA